jgi:peptidoglycan hydrolase-like protein with peptidoglycan-binding domain
VAADDQQWLTGAIRKEIAKHHRGPRPYHNRQDCHVAVSEAPSLFGYFSGADVCSHAYVRKSTPEQLAAGLPADFEQYLPIDNYSAADKDGNNATFSVESQGGVIDAQNEPWDAGQLLRLAMIFEELTRIRPSIQMKLAVDSRVGDSSNGLSDHRLGIDPWRVPGGMSYSNSRGKICPGDAKHAQMPQILALAQQIRAGEHPTVTPADPAAPAPAPVGNGGGVKNWLQQGDTGPEVEDLQRLLNARGAGLAVDGSFGPATLAAVRSFQHDAGLVIDGLAGPATMAALHAAPAPAPAPAPVGVLRRGSSGPEVERLQAFLNRNYPAYSRLKEDGLFGPATEAVVKEFQRRCGIDVDGSVGPITRSRLGI